MILLYAILLISFEAIGEGLLKRFNKADFIFNNWLQWVIALFLFGLYFILAYHFDGYYVETWKIITGFVFVRFAIFDVTYNLCAGNKWNYYGTRKWYDRFMFKAGNIGWFFKAICLIVGVLMLIGIG